MSYAPMSAKWRGTDFVDHKRMIYLESLFEAKEVTTKKMIVVHIWYGLQDR